MFSKWRKNEGLHLDHDTLTQKGYSDYSRRSIEKDRLNGLSERELMIEMIVELRKLNRRCDDIARKIVIWSD